MSAKCRKYASLMLVVVYAFFFASTNLFFHSHQLANSKLVHSHPFNGGSHSHTAGQIVLIGVTDAATYQEASSVSAPGFLPVFFESRFFLESVNPVLSPVSFSFSLRAPPASL